jgi:transketolase
MRNETIEALLKYAEVNPDVILLTGDLGFSVLETFRNALPNQYLNVGVSEQAMVGIASGLALAGHRVAVYSIANFPTLRCLEQIRNDVCYHNLPVTIISVGAGLAYGSQGYTHHGIEDIGIMSMLPNMTVACPSDPVEAIALVPFLFKQRRPSYLRLGRSGEANLHKGAAEPLLPKPIEMRKGNDIALLATGSILSRALIAAEALERLGVTASVFSFPVIKPLDAETVMLIARSHRAILTIEEHTTHGGFGSMISDLLCENNVQCRIGKWGIPDTLRMKFGSQSYLLDQLESINEKALALL